ncbi:MAG: HAMP domain-containing histidine kinase [Nitrospirae bacterium]|nr:HAMP domain-containing histidine kinase [Magnetococcales bacterium]HAT49250.1 hypothetical protein [Alphaproteobacteria bacterium]
MRQSSLQFKVTLGYYLICAIALCLSLFTLIELRTISMQLVSSEQVYLLLNNVLEMRRFEKNYFLYHQNEDFDHLQSYVTSVEQMLHNDNEDNFISIRQKTSEYANLVHHSVDNATEKAIRTLGKEIVTFAEESATTQRIQVHQALEKHRFALITSMVVVVLCIILLGRLVSYWILLPLKHIEKSMVDVVKGEVTSIDIRSNDREIISLTRAFNFVLQELQQRQKHLLRSEKLAALGTLLSGVAHELNNPLSNISTSCQIMSEEIESDDVELRRELLAQIDEQTRRTSHIVRSLLDFAQEREFKKTVFPLASLIAEVIRFSKGIIPSRVKVRVEIPDLLTLSGDRQRLQQAFINLLKNAVDAIPEMGEVLIRAQSHDSAKTPLLAGGRCHPPWVEIMVQDTGTGISEENLSRIFDPFFTTKPVGKGSGLGLAVVFDVVEEHEGDVAVESTVGQGTRFTLRLPAQNIAV